MASGTRQPRPDAAAEQSPVLLRAIRAADSQAGNDDALFLALLEKHSRHQAMTTRSRSVIPIKAAEPARRSFQILKDPRYLANARVLARRTLGGLRVLGGSRVREGDFLDCVAVGSDNEWTCTGTLIAPDVVLTAGHCADAASRVYFGHDVTKPGKVVRVKSRTLHPGYNASGHNDLLVLILEDTVEGVTPRRLATKAVVDKATDGRVVGFGNTDPAGEFGYGIKRFVDVPIASNACRGCLDGQQDRYSYGCDPGSELVAGRPMLERDSCRGDSGGPLYLLGNENGWLLGGATSRATSSAMNNCGDGGIYVRVDRYRAWTCGLPGVRLP